MEFIKIVTKVFIAFIGAVNAVFSILTPMFLSLMMLEVYPGMVNAGTLIGAGLVSSLYRGIKYVIKAYK